MTKEVSQHRREYVRKWLRERYRKNKEKYRMEIYTWRERNPERYKEIMREYRKKVRLLVLKRYGGEVPSCACCGEEQIEFLAIDHINGGGNSQRRATGSGMPFYHWLKKNNFPTGFQVLCHNCNFAKSHHPRCPHQM